MLHFKESARVYANYTTKLAETDDMTIETPQLHSGYKRVEREEIVKGFVKASSRP